MELKINSIMKTGIHKYVDNNSLLNNQRVKEEIVREIRKYLEIDENKNITYQKL